MGSAWLVVQTSVALKTVSADISGTGKTTVVVQILRQLIQRVGDTRTILMTASTHNGADG